jgi:hypothetical protein
MLIHIETNNHAGCAGCRHSSRGTDQDPGTFSQGLPPMAGGLPPLNQAAALGPPQIGRAPQTLAPLQGLSRPAARGWGAARSSVRRSLSSLGMQTATQTCQRAVGETGGSRSDGRALQRPSAACASFRSQPYRCTSHVPSSCFIFSAEC